LKKGKQKKKRKERKRKRKKQRNAKLSDEPSSDAFSSLKNTSR